MENAVVIGNGMVGKATAHAFGIEKHIDPKGSTSSYKEAGSLRYIFLCLPTPTVNGQCDTSLLKEAIQAVLDHSTMQNVFIIRSTVTPGTTKALCKMFRIDSIVHNPEFLSEDTWEKDVEFPDIIVLGCDHPVYLEDVEGVYKGRYKGANLFKTDSLTSEMTKYAINCLYATKVVFANQLYDTCQLNGANYERIKEIMYERKWIGKNHLEVFHKGKRGAGGKCLPKDLSAFAEYSQSRLLKEVKILNDVYLGGSKP